MFSSERELESFSEIDAKIDIQKLTTTDHPDEAKAAYSTNLKGEHRYHTRSVTGKTRRRATELSDTLDL